MIEAKKKESWVQFFKRLADETFFDSIISNNVRDLPKTYFYAFGLAAHCAALFIFFYFCVTVYVQGIQTKFMSLSTTSGTCTEVIKQVTGDFTADERGLWIGSEAYDYSRGRYLFRLVDGYITNQEYTDIISLADTQLSAIDAGNNDLSLNLIYLTNWKLACPDGSHCTNMGGSSFELTGDSSYMFYTGHYTGVASSASGHCNNMVATYDLANNHLTLAVSYQYYDTTAVCSKTFDPNMFGYNLFADADNFEIVFDVRTFTAAFGASHGVVSLADLDIVTGIAAFNISLSYKNFDYVASVYIDTLYPGMNPMICIQNKASTGFDEEPVNGSVNQLCFIVKGTVAILPLFMHYGDSDDVPKPCFCEGGVGRTSKICDEMDLMQGYMFFNAPNASMQEQVEALLEVVVQNDGFKQTNINAYNATWSSSAAALSDEDGMFNSTTFLNESFQFCYSNVVNMTCSIMSINSFGDTIFDRGITKYSHIVNNGSCNDILSMPAESYEAMMTLPPAPLVETYYECTKLPFDAMIDAVGIAAGNAAAVAPIVFILVLPLVYMLLECSNQKATGQEYSGEEKYLAMQYLILKELKSRDVAAESLSPVREIRRSTLVREMLSEMEMSDLDTADKGHRESYTSVPTSTNTNAPTTIIPASQSGADV